MRHRPGFTVTELLVAAVVTAVIFMVGIPLLGSQSRAVAATAGRLDAAQTARYAQNAIDRELRMVGVNTLGTQPMLVQAGPFAVTFNADLSTRDAQDMWSIYYDADADSTTTLALQPAGMALPVSGFVYPSVPELDKDGLPGRAETISFWVSADSSSARPNEYVLFRAVNRSTPTVVATGLYIPNGQPFFKYLWAKDSTGVIDTVPAAYQPLLHSTPLHGTLADTGETATLAARIDRVRSVIVTAQGQFKDPVPNAPLGRRLVRSRTALINMTMLNRPSCGLSPSPVVAGAFLVNVSGQPDHIHVLWTRATDDGSGERDIDRYLIFRSVDGVAYGDPLDEIASTNGAGAYAWDDYDVKRNAPSYPGSNTFAYAIVVQDCQPQVSTPAATSTITVPTIP